MLEREKSVDQLRQSSSEMLFQLEQYVNRFEIGSPQIIAFHDVSRLARLEIDQNNQNNIEHIQDLRFQINLMKWTIEDRRATMKKYARNHEIAYDYVLRLRNSLFNESHQKKGLMSHCYPESVKNFSEIVEKRLSKD